MIRFILNQKEIISSKPASTLLLDLIRYEQRLMGTKIGCREGDCGACTILTGEIINEKLVYRSATSCLMAIGNAHGKHIVTIEGLNVNGLNAVQQAFSDEGATQCGFCTPGFIVSLCGHCMNEDEHSNSSAIKAMNGNICRCTGYKSIERAASKISKLIQSCKADPLHFSIENNIIPEYFSGIRERLNAILPVESTINSKESKFLGGGTDLYVQLHDVMKHQKVATLFDDKSLKGIYLDNNICDTGAAATVNDIAASPVFQKYFPALNKFIKLVSSTQIRNMATVAGNLVNASPIGDLTIFFLALNARLKLKEGENERIIALCDFYKGYKQLDKAPEEYISRILFDLPSEKSFFNFEKVSKRTHLDIASVNSAMYIEMNEGLISQASISAGGVGPIPAYLHKASESLVGKEIHLETISGLLSVVQKEITPISDARGSERYKRLLLAQLIKAHFITMFPDLPAKKIMEVPA